LDLAHPALPRDEVVAVATGTAFVVIGLLAGAVAAVRRRGGVRTLTFAIEALYTNLARSFGYPSSRLLDSLGFAVLLFSFGYVALRVPPSVPQQDDITVLVIDLLEPLPREPGPLGPR